MKVWSQSQLPLQKKLVYEAQVACTNLDPRRTDAGPKATHSAKASPAWSRAALHRRSSTNPKWATLILRAFKSYSCTALLLL